MSSKISSHKIQFTAIVVTLNEERYLADCLKSLSFCEQLIVIDLGSSDNSLKIAKECGAEIINHKRVPVVEGIRAEAIHYSNNDWIIYLDPDEIFPSEIEKELRSIILNNPDLGAINAPWQFYFKGKPLHCTIWGGEKIKGIVHHRRRNEFHPEVHRGSNLIKGYSSFTLPRISKNIVKHYWSDSYMQLFEKHWRYIKKEGEAKYIHGDRFSWLTAIKSTLSALKLNLIKLDGLRGGLNGIFLSCFYSWYILFSLLSLRQYQIKIRNRQS